MRKLIADVVLGMMKQKKLNCFIFGGYVRDDLTLAYAEKQSENSEKLKSFLCKKFSATEKFDIDLAVTNLNRSEHDQLVNQMKELLISHFRFYNLAKKSNVKVVVKKMVSDSYTYHFRTLTLEFSWEGILFGVDIVNSNGTRIGPNDFWINCLAYDQDNELIIKPGALPNASLGAQLKCMSEVTFDILSGVARECDDLRNHLTHYWERKVPKRNITQLVINYPSFVRAYKRLQKMRTYGYKITNEEDYPKRIACAAKCCQKPEIVSLPKLCSGDKLVGYCLSCKKKIVRTDALKLSRQHDFSDCKVFCD